MDTITRKGLDLDPSPQNFQRTEKCVDGDGKPIMKAPLLSRSKKVHYAETTDERTYRIALSEVCSKKLITKFVQEILDQYNTELGTLDDPFVPVLVDPGHKDADHYGIHLLANANSEEKHQNPHLDGIGHFEETPRTFQDLKKYQGVMSCACLLTRHRNTQFGGNINLAEMLAQVRLGNKTEVEFSRAVSFFLQRQRIAMDQQIKKAQAVEPGTTNIFPKNLTAHRGVCKGSHEGIRYTIYFVAARRSKAASD